MYHKSIKLFIPLTFILVFFIYLQAADGPYLVDDFPNLVNNDTLILPDYSYGSIKDAAFSSPASKFYRPISMLTFAANYTITGNKSAFSVKLVNIFLHLVIGAGIYFLSRMLLPYLLQRDEDINNNLINVISILATILWLSHPLFVSTVLYPVQRMAILSAFFVIFGCILYLNLRVKIITKNYGYTTLLFSVPLITLCGFLAKENAFLLPGFLLLIEYYCFNFKFHEKTPVWFIRILKSFLFIPVIFVIAYLAYAYMRSTGETLPNYSFTLNERVLTQPRILWHYLGWLTFLNPEPLGIYHDDIPLSTDLLQPWTTLFSLAGWVMLVIVAVRLNKYSGIFSFSLLWFLWGHSIESTVIPLAMVFEHRNYLPGYGPVLALAGLIGLFLQKRKSGSMLVCSILLLLLVLPNLLLYERTQRWSEQQSLVIWLLDKHPDSVHTLSLSANYLSEAGDTHHAMEALDRAKALSPSDTAVMFNRIRILCKDQPGRKFDDQLVERIHSISVDSITENSRMYYNHIVNNCGESSINYDFLQKLYERFSNSSDRSIRALSFTGTGKIHLQRGNYEEVIEAWQKAVDTSSHANALIPEIRKLQDITNQKSR